MFKNKVSFVLILVIIVIPAISLGAEIDSADIFDKIFLEKGIIGVNYESNTETKVMIEKGNNKYFYDLKFGDKFPLQFGNGEYVIAILEKVEGNKFKLIKSYKISVNIENQNDVYLGSIQKINWNEDMEAIKKSKEITKDLKTDKEKVAAVYNYIVNNIKYDYLKITRIDSSYIPSIEETFKTNKGICYDFSSLFAAMLRCFLQVKIPQFCKSFSPGTGGEFLC
jgi:hypothetical protein